MPSLCGSAEAARERFRAFAAARKHAQDPPPPPHDYEKEKALHRLTFLLVGAAALIGSPVIATIRHTGEAKRTNVE
jgi:hypothetical protein